MYTANSRNSYNMIRNNIYTYIVSVIKQFCFIIYTYVIEFLEKLEAISAHFLNFVTISILKNEQSSGQSWLIIFERNKLR